jgi:hypothetical protein
MSTSVAHLPDNDVFLERATACVVNFKRGLVNCDNGFWETVMDLKSHFLDHKRKILLHQKTRVPSTNHSWLLTAAVSFHSQTTDMKKKWGIVLVVLFLVAMTLRNLMGSNLAGYSFLRTSYKGDIKRQQPPSNNNNHTANATAIMEERCALCFFGLPRAFDLVLPSITQHILVPNAGYNCDIYVHFYEQYTEPEGRWNTGGTINPRQVHLLTEEAHRVQTEYVGSKPTNSTGRLPTVAFCNDTETSFFQKRGEALNKYLYSRNPVDGLPLYFPYKHKDYMNSTVVNIVKQWHSIESAFHLLETTTRRQGGVKYTRVGMFRLDVMFLTPIDISLLDKGEVDQENKFAVVPGFGQWPVNDRMVYGPYDAVNVWSTKRFELIEERARQNNTGGIVFHPEKFMKASLFPAMTTLGYGINTNLDICFSRTRPDNSVIISDCTSSGSTRGWDQVQPRALVERIAKRNCTEPYQDPSKTFRSIRCGGGIENATKG